MLPGRLDFPIQELIIVCALLGLIAVALYLWAGAWGVVLLWSFGALLVLPIGGSAVALFLEARERAATRDWTKAAALIAAAMLVAVLWLGTLGYCAYRALRAIP